jgi:flagellin
MSALTDGITSVDAKRGGLGAIQNRLESTIANANSIIENASAARSRIRDADFAVETANLTRAQILQQAGTSVLSQANAIPQGVLSLLQ